MTTPEISAIVVAWNAGETLATCVAALRASATDAEVDLQVVVVDNASSDHALDDVPLEHGDVTIRNPVNAGYGVAVSQGAARATAPWLLLVNPDVVVSTTFVATLLEAAAEARADVATLVPEMRYELEPGTVNCRGITVDELGIPAEIDAGRAAAVVPVGEPLGGSSGCCMIRRDAVRVLGGFELAYFAYLEDVDLAVRLARAGYRAELVPRAVVWHRGSAAAGPTSPLKTFLVARNRRVLFRLEGPTGVGLRMRRTIVEAGHMLVSSLISSPSTPFLGRLDALRLRSYTSYARRARRRFDPRGNAPPLGRAASLRSTLRRKRTATRAARH